MTPRTLRRVQLFTEGNDTNCVICLEDFAEGDHVSITKCNHRGHVQCLNVWCALPQSRRASDDAAPSSRKMRPTPGPHTLSAQCAASA